MKNHSGEMTDRAVTKAAGLIFATAAITATATAAVEILAFSVSIVGAAVLAAMILLAGVLCFLLMRSSLKKTLHTVMQLEQAAKSAVPDLRGEQAVAALAERISAGGSDAETVTADAVWLLREIGAGRYQAKSRCPEKYSGCFEPLLSAIYETRNHLDTTARDIQTKLNELTGGAGQLAANTELLSRDYQSESETVEEITAAMNDIATVLDHSASLRNSARQMFKDSADGFATCNAKMEEMMAAMADISSKTSGIGKIIKSIDDLAFQTNILALNAAVEAARAGNAGRGFSVVADEVRNLAMKSAQAAQDSGNMVTEAVKAVENGSHLAKETADALQFINENSQKVTAITNEIGKDSQAQTEGIQRVSVGLDQIVTAVQSSSAAVQESAAVEQRVNQKAAELQTTVEQLMAAS